MTGSGKTGLCVGIAGRSRPAGHPRHHHRPQGRPDQPASALSRSAAAGFQALDGRRAWRAAQARRVEQARSGNRRHVEARD
ncbi:MAG: hypothetical protein MZV64_17900 [Ignavibacteriales bacterium]|nr:hypothetical protein [Ignavibacteriales bacterium]